MSLFPPRDLKKKDTHSPFKGEQRYSNSSYIKNKTKHEPSHLSLHERPFSQLTVEFCCCLSIPHHAGTISEERNKSKTQKTERSRDEAC